jgi:hypothetical protein
MVSPSLVRLNVGSLVVVGLTVAGAATTLSAHRQDELLQATRIAIEPREARIEVDVTPGIAVAPEVLADIDRNGDGTLARDEQLAYANTVLDALDVRLDGATHRLVIVAVDFPEPAAVRLGDGTIRLAFRVSMPDDEPGVRHLSFRNSHRAAESVYLANALVPSSARVAVRAQQRDEQQRHLTIEYEMRPPPRADRLAWTLLPAGGLLFAAYRARREASRRTS